VINALPTDKAGRNAGRDISRANGHAQGYLWPDLWGNYLGIYAANLNQKSLAFVTQRKLIKITLNNCIA
jgi:hypothetical protein